MIKEAGITVDKTFELFEKMYSDINKRFDSLEAKIDQKADKTDIVRLGHEHGHKLDVLFDGYVQLYEKLQEHDKRFEEIDKRFEKIDKRFDEHDKRFDSSPVYILFTSEIHP